MAAVTSSPAPRPVPASSPDPRPEGSLSPVPFSRNWTESCHLGTGKQRRSSFALWGGPENPANQKWEYCRVGRTGPMAARECRAVGRAFGAAPGRWGRSSLRSWWRAPAPLVWKLAVFCGRWGNLGWGCRRHGAFFSRSFPVNPSHRVLVCRALTRNGTWLYELKCWQKAAFAVRCSGYDASRLQVLWVQISMRSNSRFSWWRIAKVVDRRSHQVKMQGHFNHVRSNVILY